MQRRTDLALESREMYRAENNHEVPGVKVKTEMAGNTQITRVKIINDEGEKEIGKPVGSYITLELPLDIRDKGAAYELAIDLLCTQLKGLMKDRSGTVLIVGLGNRSITPDSLGPRVVGYSLVTRHLFDLLPDNNYKGYGSVCAITPGVLGITGIETGEIIRGVVDRVKPDLVIAIDALASRRMDRVNRTIQLSDTGITPGSGVGNHRNGITEETLGVPVIAIGVPTVVDAATMANDTIDMILDELMDGADQGGDFYKMLQELDRDEKYSMIQEVLTPKGMGDLIVTPKDIDEVVDTVAQIISGGINLALHPSMTLEDLGRY
ncbi:MAG: GPR endopeptidase [Eubacteriales bacterium]|nr:GPR endopeptidase [Eubacteriales bacterium]